MEGPSNYCKASGPVPPIRETSVWGAVCGHSSIQVAEPPLRGALWGGNAGGVCARREAVLEGLLAGGSAEVSPTGLPSSKIPKPGQNTPGDPLQGTPNAPQKGSWGRPGRLGRTPGGVPRPSWDPNGPR